MTQKQNRTNQTSPVRINSEKKNSIENFLCSFYRKNARETYIYIKYCHHIVVDVGDHLFSPEDQKTFLGKTFLSNLNFDINLINHF